MTKKLKMKNKEITLRQSFQTLFCEKQDFDEKTRFLDKWDKAMLLLTATFISVAEKKKYPRYDDEDYRVEAEIFSSCLPGLQVAVGNFPKGDIVMQKETMPIGDIAKTALKFPVLQAMKRITTEVKNGFFDKHGKTLIIYLTDDNDHVLRWLRSDRNGAKLEIMMCDVDPNQLSYAIGPVTVFDDWHITA
jgi:hypothetical protein